MALERKLVEAEAEPEYPDTKHYRRERRTFLAMLGLGAAGLAGTIFAAAQNLSSLPQASPAGEVRVVRPPALTIGPPPPPPPARPQIALPCDTVVTPTPDVDF